MILATLILALFIPPFAADNPAEWCAWTIPGHKIKAYQEWPRCKDIYWLDDCAAGYDDRCDIPGCEYTEECR